MTQRCGMCASEMIPTASGLGLICRHCDKGCTTCHVDAETGDGVPCPLGQGIRGYDGRGPGSRAWKADQR